MAVPIRTAPSETPAGPPSVQVTIGRVEVRAIMPPSSAPPRRLPPRPRLSLDDYLKQRNNSAR